MARLLLRALWRALWWLVRLLWQLTWRLTLLALAVLLAPFSRGVAWRVVRRALSGRREGRGGTGQRTTDNAEAGQLVPVKVRPRPMQSVASWNRTGPDWIVQHLIGSGLLTMFYAAAGVGKTEALLGMLRAAVDGVPFCGLTTRRPRKVLLLTEQDDASLEPAAVRWGFALKPAGRIDELRRRWLRWCAPGGHVITIVAASEMFATQADGRRPTWVEACRWAIAYAERHGYDVLIVDSLQRWMGGDTSAQTMLDALAELRQGTRRGLAGVVLHHPPRSGGHARGASQIDGEVDVLWKMSRREGAPATDPVRILSFDKHRFQEEAPASLAIERVYDPARPDVPPTYRLTGGSAANAQRVAHSVSAEPNRQRVAALDPDSRPSPTLPPQVRAVLGAVEARGDQGGTVAQLAQAAGISRQRADEAVKALLKAKRIHAAGTVRPEGGGPPAVRYVATEPVRCLTTSDVGLDIGTTVEAFLRHQGVPGDAA